MEISLKVELSDEQYSQLMQSSYDEIFKDEALLNELRETIMKQFSDYFNGVNENNSKASGFGLSATSFVSKRRFVEQALLDTVPKSDPYQGYTNYEPTNLLTNLVADATREQMEDFRLNVQRITQGLLDNPKTLSTIIYDVIIGSVMSGVSQGTAKMIENNKHRDELLDNIIHAYLHRND